MQKLLLMIVAVGLVGCGTPSSPSSRSSRLKAQSEFDAFMLQSIKLEVGLPLDEVRDLLGNPTKFRTEQVGQKSESGPWTALIYDYKFKGVKSDKKNLMVFFSKNKTNGNWILNSWRWW